MPYIVNELHSNKMFFCYKTIDYTNQTNEDTGEFTADYKRNKMCAGAMIFLEKQNTPNRLMELGKRAGYLSKDELLKHKDCVIDSLDEREICE
ncbi:hypothetical protein [Bacillus sp. FJAT-53711]|uniref:hypothetical protein n=1 Tax=Bacillus yunxiaonensis TaxID=3127665 RepID=UPI003013421F